MKPWLKRTLIGIGVVVIGIQLIPVDRSNPPEPAPIQVDAVTDQATMAILERSCFDCHSNKTEWPWYSYVAPVSWLVAHDVEEGREHLNFSEWGNWSPAERAHAADEGLEEVADGEMPMGIYLITHGDAAISPEDQQVLLAWASRAFQAAGGSSSIDSDDDDDEAGHVDHD